MRSWRLAVALLGLWMATWTLAANQDPGADGPRAVQSVTFTFDDFARWVIASKPEVAMRPINLALVFDRTDSVWGTGKQKDVLYTVWQRDLLGNLLQGFLVQGQPSRGVEGDTVSIFGFGRRALDPIEVGVSYSRTNTNDLKQSLPKPYVNTPPELGGTFLDARLDDAIRFMGVSAGSRNTLIVLVTDDIVQGDDAAGPAKAQTFRTYRAELQAGAERVFTVYLHWNDFPDDTQFLRFDPTTQSLFPESRTDRAEAQAGGRSAALEGTTAALPKPALEARDRRTRRALAVLAVVLVVIALLAFLLYRWFIERFEVRDDHGLINRSVYVFPGRGKRLVIKDPAQPNEAIAALTAAPKLPFGLSRLRMQPGKGYTLLDAKGSRIRRSGRRRDRTKAFLILAANQRKPTSHVVRFFKGDEPSPGAQGSTEAAADADLETMSAVTLFVSRRVGGKGGSKRAKRARRSATSSPTADGARSRGSGTGRKKRRHVDLSDLTEGDEP